MAKDLEKNKEQALEEALKQRFTYREYSDKVTN